MLVLNPLYSDAQTLINNNTTITVFVQGAAPSISNGASYALTPSARIITWQTAFTGTPTSVTVVLQGSNDNSNWAALDTSTSTAGEIRSLYTATAYIRVAITAVVAGSATADSVTVRTNTGTTFTNSTRGLFGDGTNALPSWSFASNPTTGWYWNPGAGPTLTVGSTDRVAFGSSTIGEQLQAAYPLSWATGSIGSGSDVYLYRDAANTLALKNGVNIQTFRIYGTTTGPKYLLLAADATTQYIGGTGATNLGGGGIGQYQWSFNTGGMFAAVDNTYDIGAAGANRPRDIYLAGNVRPAGQVKFTNGTSLSAGSDGVLLLTDSAGTNFGRIQFGGPTNSFPSLKRTSLTIASRLADDSGDAGLSGSSIVASGSYQLGAKVLVNATAPTIASGFGTSPSIIANNGTAAFTVNVGTGGTATSGVITMPAATSGWICHVDNLSAAAGHVAYNTRQTATTTTSVTIENQTTSTGAAVAWGASNTIFLSCFAY